MKPTLSSHPCDLYAALGLQPQDFQQACLDAYDAGCSGLVSVPTGSGKTLAVLAGPLQRMAREAAAGRQQQAQPAGRQKGHRLQLLLITPLRALTRDTAQAIAASISRLGLTAEVGQRTGDISSYQKQQQAAAMPEILVITPESLALLLARKDASKRFRHLHTVIIDEWHALLANKRGTMTELCLARLRQWRPQLQTWALSATIGDPALATRHAVGIQHLASAVLVTATTQQQATPLAIASATVQAAQPMDIDLDLIIPPSEKTLPWAGHLGLRMGGALLRQLSPDVPTILFTNTRRQAEQWFQYLCEKRPQLAHRIALHHGSLDQATREANEAAAKAGTVVWTVATASLDLGIDYPGIDLVVQIGSAKGVARLCQRAGRAGHRPGARSRLLFVPTHAMELVEFRALQQALASGQLEPVIPVMAPQDVLAQHLVTLACGEGFIAEEMLAEIRYTAAYATISDEDFARTLQFIRQGGACLTRYDHYKKAAPDAQGVWRVTSRRLAAEHRMNIGTIVADAQVTVAYRNRRQLGTVEEHFITRLRPGDTFFFAGQHLRFDKMRQQTAIVSKATDGRGVTPAWAGGTLPISPTLAAELRQAIAAAPLTNDTGPAATAIAAVLQAQDHTSVRPAADELLIELLDSCQGLASRHSQARYAFVHAFAGRHVHEGLGALLALRLGRLQPLSCVVRLHDYGLVIEAPRDYPFERLLTQNIFSPQQLQQDLVEALNLDALTRRSFRAVCRIGGILNEGLPGSQRSRRQVQASAELLFDVFCEHEPDHLLLQEARREVMHTALDAKRLGATLQRLHQSHIRLQQLSTPSPLAFPLLIENLHHSSSNESIDDQIARLQAAYGIDADD